MDSNDKNKSDDELHQDKQPAASGIYKCEFCDNKFSSGKALGGHKRVHQLQALRKEGGTSNNNNSNNGTITMIKSSSSNGKRKQRCHVCNKDFPSNKSLYGHMRSHPYRDWRGIHPPIPSSNNHCSDDDHAELLSAIAALKKPVTFIDASISFPPSCHNAAHILVHMSRDNTLNGSYGDDCNRLNGGKDFSEFGVERVSTDMDSDTDIIDDTVKNSDNKRRKLVVKLKAPRGLCDNKENNNRLEDEIGESSQSGSRRIIRDFDLNELPKSE